MKNIFFVLFALITTQAFGQWDQVVNRIAKTPAQAVSDDSVFCVKASSREAIMKGEGVWVVVPSGGVAENIFNADLTADDSHTHDAGGFSTTINNSSGLSVTSTGDGYINMGESTFSAGGTGSTVSIGNNVASLTASVQVYISSLDEILLDGVHYKIANLPTYTDDAAAGIGGLESTELYKTAIGVVMIKL